MTNSLKLGDVACLASGGPDMTITAFNGDAVRCEWFVGSSLKNSEFPKAALRASGLPTGFDVRFISADNTSLESEH